MTRTWRVKLVPRAAMGSAQQLEMESTIKEDPINPWIVSSMYEFMYCCCPECDEKLESKQDFVNHASSYHIEVS